MPPCIGQIVDLMIYLSGLLRLSIQCGSTIVFRMLGQDLLLWNYLPRNGLTMDILRCHVWGCPVYVLEVKLQNDQKLPKWNRRAVWEFFLGFQMNIHHWQLMLGI